MRWILILLLFVGVSSSYGQSLRDLLPRDLDLGELNLEYRYGGKYGVTHHTIKTNKMQLMHSCNESLDLLVKFKRRRNLGYVEVGVGTALMIFAGSIMKVPQWYSDGRTDRQARNRRSWRYAVTGIGALINLDGIIKIGKNIKLINRIEYHLTPIEGGLRFTF